MRSIKLLLSFLIIIIVVATCGRVDPYEGEAYAQASYDAAYDDIVLISPYTEDDITKEEIAAYSASSTPAEYDLGVLITPEARAYWNAKGIKIERLVNDHVIYTNESLENSLVPHRFRLVLIEDVPGPSKGAWDDVFRLQNPNDGVWDEWAGYKRVEHGLDLVLVISGNGGQRICGVAWTPNAYTMQHKTHAYGAVPAKENCWDKPSFSHEAGHAVGAHHEISILPDCWKQPLEPNTCGYMLPNTNKVTIMSYFDRTWQEYIPHYSNEQVYFEGVPTGNTKANNAYVIRSWMPFGKDMFASVYGTDVFVDNAMYVLAPGENTVTVSGTTLVDHSIVTSPNGDVTMLGANKWRIDNAVIDPNNPVVTLTVNGGLPQTKQLNVKVADFVVEGTITGIPAGMTLSVTSDKGIPTTAESDGSYSINVVEGPRVISANGFDQETSTFCFFSDEILVATNPTSYDFEVTCTEGVQTFLPIIER